MNSLHRPNEGDIALKCLPAWRNSPNGRGQSRSRASRSPWSLGFSDMAIGAERQIIDVLNRFARALDERDWSALDSILTEDATGEYSGGHRPKGRNEFVRLFHSVLGGCGPSQHLLGNIKIVIDATTAESWAYSRVMHQGAGAKSHLTFDSLGEYYDRWRVTPDGWRIYYRRRLQTIAIGSPEVLGQAE